MKITEKMYLLAKEIVEEYESNQDIVEHLEGGTSIVVVERGKWIDEATQISKDQYDAISKTRVMGVDFLSGESKSVEWTKDFLNKSPNDIEVTDPKEVKPKTKKEEDFSFEVRNCYLQCYSLFDEDLRPKNNKDTIAWHDTIEKLNRIDKLEFNDIVLITQAARNDIFWKKNFLSLVKLRRKDKDKIPYWKVFKEKFKFEKSKTQSMMEMHNQAKRDLGI